MKNKKSIKKPQDETVLHKLGGFVGEIAGKLSNQKDHLIDIADNTIESIKTAVHNIAEKKQPTAKKAIKKPTKKAAKKLLTRVVKKVKKAVPTKKAPTPKKIVKKSAKSPVNKVVKKATKQK